MKYWFKNSIIYSVNVNYFKDDNGDGRGDFSGLKERLEYLAGLGINTLWLLPIFCSPEKDNGYDVTDFYNINPNKGDMGEFVDFLDIAEDLSIRIIIDLPINHTSDQHPWFKEACANPDSKYHNFYLWSDEKPEDHDENLVFPGQQTSHWAYNEQVGKFYYHTFYSFQPDLNYDNPEVMLEVKRIMHFWLRLGISGFRIDAAPHIIKQKGNVCYDNPHSVLKRLRQYVEEISSNAILLGETNVDPTVYEEFFGVGTEFHMLFNFYLANYIFLSLARKNKSALVFGLNSLPKSHPFEQYANFLRNHDELDLGQLKEDEQEEVMQAFAPKEKMQVFKGGIKRRLAPMLQDPQLIRLAYSLLFSMPGAPTIWYGDEIGMGDDLELKGRASVHTLMQWSDKKNGGFSDVSKEKLIRPAIEQGPYGYDLVNVAMQQRDSESLLNWMEKLIRVRTKCMEFGRGNYKLIETDNEHVLAHMSKFEKEVSVVFHNLSDQEQTVPVKFNEEEVSEIYEVFADKHYENLIDHKSLSLNGYGYRWFKGKLAQLHTE